MKLGKHITFHSNPFFHIMRKEVDGDIQREVDLRVSEDIFNLHMLFVEEVESKLVVREYEFW